MPGDAGRRRQGDEARRLAWRTGLRTAEGLASGSVARPYAARSRALRKILFRPQLPHATGPVGLRSGMGQRQSGDVHSTSAFAHVSGRQTEVCLTASSWPIRATRCGPDGAPQKASTCRPSARPCGFKSSLSPSTPSTPKADTACGPPFDPCTGRCPADVGLWASTKIRPEPDAHQPARQQRREDCAPGARPCEARHDGGNR